MDDIRLKTDFPDHPKTTRLSRLAGPGAVRCLLRLWCYSRGAHPVGTLSGLDGRTVETRAGWTGEPGKLVDSLVMVGYLDFDKETGIFSLHDWKEHQPWAVNQEMRSASASHAARMRWASEAKCPSPLPQNPEEKEYKSENNPEPETHNPTGRSRGPHERGVILPAVRLTDLNGPAPKPPSTRTRLSKAKRSGLEAEEARQQAANWLLSQQPDPEHAGNGKTAPQAAPGSEIDDTPRQPDLPPERLPKTAASRQAAIERMLHAAKKITP